jgi:hypothetical protein
VNKDAAQLEKGLELPLEVAEPSCTPFAAGFYVLAGNANCLPYVTT